MNCRPGVSSPSPVDLIEYSRSNRLDFDMVVGIARRQLNRDGWVCPTMLR